MPQEEEFTPRITQRAPRSCVACRKRKTRCEKRIPCRQCIDRGTAASCCREAVLVRGQVLTSSSIDKAPSYDDLLSENKYLHARLAGLDIQSEARWAEYIEADTDSERFEELLFRYEKTNQAELTVRDVSDIVQCSKTCSDALIRYGKLWTSWIHFAIYHPEFEEEHRLFWDPSHGNGDLTKHDPAWLAIYFAYICSNILLMEERLVLDIGLSSDDLNFLCNNWYHASLYYLQEADFMRKPDIRNVQAIAILNLVFNNIGDGLLYPVIWAATIRIAQSLRLDRDDEPVKESLVARERRRRLWWTLVICEWLPLPHRNPLLAEADNHVALPANLDDDELRTGHADISRSKDFPRQIRYHIALCQIASAYHRFRRLLRIGPWSSSDLLSLVRRADEELANIIAALPPHLQPDEEINNDTVMRNAKYPWIRDQMRHLTRVLLYRRITINRTLQKAWLDQPVLFAGPRFVCLSTCKALISSLIRSEVPIERQRSAPFTSSMFAAAIPLVIEAQHCASEGGVEFMEDVTGAIQFLRRVQSWSSIASGAVKILESMVTSMEVS